MSSKAIGERARKLIKSKDWTIADTAKKSDIPLDSLKNLLYGKYKTTNIHALEKLSDALDCSIDDLVYGQKAGFDKTALDEAIEAIDRYLNKNNRECSRSKLVKLANNLSLFISKRRVSNPSYKIDDEIIELLLETM